MKTSKKTLLVLIFIIASLSGCSMGQMIARSTVSILDGSVDAMNRETDLVLAEQAIPANLKLIEGLIAEDKNNRVLPAYAAQGFYGYAFGFVELDSPARALPLYRRGLEHALNALRLFGFNADIGTSTPDTIRESVSKLGHSAVPALFWAASNWAKMIDLNRTDPTLLADMGSVEALMQRVQQLQPDYYYGGPSTFYGVYLGSRSPMFGGNFTKSEQNFTDANTVSNGKLLIIDVLQAEYLERQRLNQEKFRSLLQAVIDTPVGHFPEMALVNQIARKRARYLLTKEEEWF